MGGYVFSSYTTNKCGMFSNIATRPEIVLQLCWSVQVTLIRRKSNRFIIAHSSSQDWLELNLFSVRFETPAPKSPSVCNAMLMWQFQGGDSCKMFFFSSSLFCFIFTVSSFFGIMLCLCNIIFIFKKLLLRTLFFFIIVIVSWCY